MQTITEEMQEEEEQSFVFNTEVRQTTGSFVYKKLKSLPFSEIEKLVTENEDEAGNQLSKENDEDALNGRMSPERD